MNSSDINPTGFGIAASDYAKHRAGFPPELLDRLEKFGVGLPEQRLLDLGTGTGTLARQFAAKGCEVTGLDPDARMLQSAAQLTRDEGTEITFFEAAAEDTGLAAESFDVVVAGQCWHWFDGSRVAAEIRRLLVPGGTLVICHFDWIPVPGNVVHATEALIVAHNPKWNLAGGNGLWPQWLPTVQAAQFIDIETFSFDLAVPYTMEGWRGRIRASAGITALDDQATATFDADLAKLLADRFPGKTVHADHRVWAMVAKPQ